jgi:flagellar hook-associated protein 3 FlgL
MTFTTVSSNYLSTALLPAVRQAQSQLATLEVESSTGQYADLGLQLGSTSGYELSLKTQDDLLQAMTAANGVTGANMATAQSALSSILSSAQTAAQSLMHAGSGPEASTTLQTIGQTNLQQLIALANTTSAGGYVFAGENTQQAPLDDYFSQPTSAAKSAIDAAFQSYFGFSTNSMQVSTITPSQIRSFLSGPFATQFASANWTSNWSTASNFNTVTEVSPGNTIETSTNANSPAFQDLAAGYTMLAEFANIGLSSDAQNVLVSNATSSISQGISSLISVQAQLGQSQSQLSAANTAMASQLGIIQKELSSTDTIDPAQIATDLTTLSTQLETAYRLTAQIHNLNLAQYLPA